MQLTNHTLWEWANAFARQSEDAGLGTEYPTIRRAARRFKCKQEDVYRVAQEGYWTPDFYDQASIAERCAERYLGTASWFTEVEEPLGDHVVEAY
jgi:hypothetical protein